jgi:hypothetical protein
MLDRTSDWNIDDAARNEGIDSTSWCVMGWGMVFGQNDGRRRNEEDGERERAKMLGSEAQRRWA